MAFSTSMIHIRKLDKIPLLECTQILYFKGLSLIRRGWDALNYLNYVHCYTSSRKIEIYTAHIREYNSMYNSYMWVFSSGGRGGGEKRWLIVGLYFTLPRNIHYI